MRGQLKDTIEYEGTSLEEDVAPVPAVILDDVVGLRLHPQIEPDERKSADPSSMW